MPLILGGRYLPQKLLGQGGFGTAFLAIDRHSPNQRPCVVKQFQPAGSLSGKQLAIAQGLFEREAQVLDILGSKHPQIPNFYAFFPLIVENPKTQQEEQFFYLVQEFINGEDLEQEQKRRGRFTETEVLEVLYSILDVLSFVHNQDTIHRDIKPSNIMRTPEGILYLLDFGAVKQITAEATASGRSTGIFTPGYAPPEQMASALVYPASDLYALAVTCIHLLTGKPPEELFDSYNNQWQWHQYAPHINEKFRLILDKMLESTPKDRFATAPEVLGFLEKYMPLGQSRPQPITARITQPPQPAPSPSKFKPPVNTRPQKSTPPAKSSAPVKSPRPQKQKPTPSRGKKPIALIPLLGNALFTGVEGTFIYLTSAALLPTPALAIGTFGGAIAFLLLAQYRRWLSGFDLPVVALISLGLAFFPVVVQGAITLPALLIVAGVCGAMLVLITTIFGLVYKLLSKFL